VEVGVVQVLEENKHSILGIIVNNNLTWQDHVYEKGGLLSSVRYRVGTLRRLSYQILLSYLPRIASAIIGAKIRYGIAVYGAVRKNASEPITTANKDLQVALNDAMRIATNCRLTDRVSVSDLISRTGIESVNRMSAQSKIMLAWQATKVPDSPLRDLFPEVSTEAALRSKARGDFRTSAKTSLGQRNLPDSAIQIWNQTPPELRRCHKKNTAKFECKKFVSSLPQL